MKERELTIFQAWEDFEKNILPTLKGKIRWQEFNRVQQARRDYAAEKLKEKRIRNLLTKYAPDRYRFEERVILIEKAST